MRHPLPELDHAAWRYLVLYEQSIPVRAYTQERDSSRGVKPPVSCGELNS